MQAKRSLISPDELRQLLEAGAGQPTLLDVRWRLSTGPALSEYLAGHLPGAVFVDLDAELAAPPGAGGRHPLPAAGAFAASMRAAGVRNDRPVAVYDAADSVAAARAWWLLRYHGHPEVAVLDGGLPAWTAAGYAVEHEVPRVQPGDFVARPGAMPLLDAGQAAALTRDGVLLDARTPQRFRGEQEPIDPIAGHIPGAVNRPSTENVTGSGQFRSTEELRAAFAGLGVGEATAVGAYCGSGVTAAHEVLALELAGYRAALYAGSWSEWITDPARPVATGER